MVGRAWVMLATTAAIGRMMLAVDQVDGWEGLGNAGRGDRNEEDEVLDARHVV
jgi:hypothetical protein